MFLQCSNSEARPGRGGAGRNGEAEGMVSKKNRT